MLDFTDRFAELRYYGYKLRAGERITPRQLFGLEIVRDPTKFIEALPAIDRACDEAGLHQVNAYISGRAEGGVQLELEAAMPGSGISVCSPG